MSIMSEQNPVFGIDLGTTYSCIAYVDESNRPTVVPNAGGQRTTPSVVQFAEEGEIVVGMAAKDSSALYPDTTISLIKREIGRNTFRFEYEEKTYTPEEISSFILRKLVQDAEQQTGYKISDVVITCPAYFGSPERDATAQAGAIAGLNVLSIINEPTAAAISYGVNEQTDQTVLVYDLGGGTFDVTIIKIESGNIIVVCTDGDHYLGGSNWDETLLNYFATEWCRQNNSNEDPLESSETLNEWSLAAEKYKQTLTGKSKTEFNLAHNGQKARISLTRDTFDQLTENLLSRTIEKTQLVIAEAKKRGITEFDKVLLVGGSTRMPQIASRLEQELGIKPEFSDPDESVAKGAAIYGFKLRLGQEIIARVAEELGKKPEEIDIKDVSQDELKKAKDELAVEWNLPSSVIDQATTETITNVTSRSFGVIAYKDNQLRVVNLIICNDPLPAKVTKQFGTQEDNQTTAEIVIVDNLSSDDEYDLPPASRELGKAELEIPPGLKKGSPIEITYELNEQGRLEMHAKELVGGKEVRIEIETEAGASESEIEEAKARSKNLSIT
jgi:molecular chaperone DnaK (HSP70)